MNKDNITVVDCTDVEVIDIAGKTPDEIEAIYKASKDKQRNKMLARDLKKYADGWSNGEHDWDNQAVIDIVDKAIIVSQLVYSNSIARSEFLKLYELSM